MAPSETQVVAEAVQPLSAIARNGSGIVVALQGGRHFCSRMASLGFTIGAPVNVIQNYGHGPLIVNVRGTMVALGRLEASRVLVRTAQPDGTGGK